MVSGGFWGEVVDETVGRQGGGRFRGRSEHSLDGKGRISIPARFRDVLLGDYDNQLLITPPWRKCLRIYPLPEWERQEASLMGLEQQQPHVAKIVRYLVGGSVQCQFDRNGRILLPVHLRNQLNLRKEIVMNGMLTFFEVWDKDTWQAENVMSEQDFANIDETFNKLGMF